MDTSGWDIALSISTVVLAVATTVLVITAIVAGTIALGESRQARDLADIDIRRRRAEITLEALRRFMALHDEQHPIMLDAARAVTKRRTEEEHDAQAKVRRCRIQDLLTEDAIRANEPPEDMTNALQNCLDGLEEIGTGVALGVYDEYVLYHGAFNRISDLVSLGATYIRMSREGTVPHRRAQHTAFVMSENLRDRLREIENEGSPKTLAGALNEGSIAAKTTTDEGPVDLPNPSEPKRKLRRRRS